MSAAAYEAITATLPADATLAPAQRDKRGAYLIHVEERRLRQLGTLRQPGEGHSDVIVRLAAAESRRVSLADEML